MQLSRWNCINCLHDFQVVTATGIAFINSFGQPGSIFSPFMVGKVKETTGSKTIGLCVIAGVFANHIADVVRTAAALAFPRELIQLRYAVDAVSIGRLETRPKPPTLPECTRCSKCSVSGVALTGNVEKAIAVASLMPEKVGAPPRQRQYVVKVMHDIASQRKELRLQNGSCRIVLSDFIL